MYFIFDQSVKYSGNKQTLVRLSKLLNIERTNSLLNNLITINSYKFGLVKTENIRNYIIIIGGTDVNFDIHKNPKKFNIVLKILKSAKYVVVFSEYLYSIVHQIYNIDRFKIKIIPQSIPKHLKISKRALASIMPKLINKKFFVSVGNLRPIKRPDYLFSFFKKSKKYSLVIIGDIIEGSYDFPKNVYHIGALRKKEVYACIKQSCGLINTSLSEGMSLSILEAMKLKCPVYAFNNRGNRSIIKHGFNGLIFYDVRSFKFIIRMPTKKIIRNAHDYVYIKHSTRLEKYEYLRLLD